MVGIEIMARVGEKGQVVIPKPIRDQFKIGTETELVFAIDENRIILEKKKKGLELLDEFFVKKIKLPKKIDWDREHYAQYGNLS